LIVENVTPLPSSANIENQEEEGTHGSPSPSPPIRNKEKLKNKTNGPQARGRY
jgi:hypothetical protein